MRQHQDIVSPQCIHADSCRAVEIEGCARDDDAEETQSLVTRGSQSLATNHPCFQTSGLAQGACRPLIERKRFSGFCRFCRFYGFKGVGAAQIIMKRRGVLIAFRAVVISSVAEKSILQNAHYLM